MTCQKIRDNFLLIYSTIEFPGIMPASSRSAFHPKRMNRSRKSYPGISGIPKPCRSRYSGFLFESGGLDLEVDIRL